MKSQKQKILYAVLERQMAIDEVYYCGKCHRQQEPSKGIRCTECGRRTVSWNIRAESEAEALRRWKAHNPMPGKP
jgi:hypothetical protein